MVMGWFWLRSRSPRSDEDDVAEDDGDDIDSSNDSDVEEWVEVEII